MTQVKFQAAVNIAGRSAQGLVFLPIITKYEIFLANNIYIIFRKKI